MRRIFVSVIMVCMLVITPNFAVTTAISADDLLSQMTLEDKVKFVVGMGMRFPGMPSSTDPTVGQTQDRVPGAAGSTLAIPRLNILSMVVADGPAGLRITPIREGDSSKTYYATAFPIASSLASTWNTELIEQVGCAVGNEVLEFGVDIILMPALNLYASESADLLTAILRQDWGFDGFVMTDWFGGKDAVAQMKAGNDLLMPGRPEQSQVILQAVQNGQLDVQIIDTNVKRILNVILSSPAYKQFATISMSTVSR